MKNSKKWKNIFRKKWFNIFATSLFLTSFACLIYFSFSFGSKVPDVRYFSQLMDLHVEAKAQPSYPEYSHGMYFNTTTLDVNTACDMQRKCYSRMSYYSTYVLAGKDDIDLFDIQNDFNINWNDVRLTTLMNFSDREVMETIPLPLHRVFRNSKGEIISYNNMNPKGDAVTGAYIPSSIADLICDELGFNSYDELLNDNYPLFIYVRDNANLLKCSINNIYYDYESVQWNPTFLSDYKDKYGKYFEYYSYWNPRSVILNRTCSIFGKGTKFLVDARSSLGNYSDFLARAFNDTTINENDAFRFYIEDSNSKGLYHWTKANYLDYYLQSTKGLTNDGILFLIITIIFGILFIFFGTISVCSFVFNKKKFLSVKALTYISFPFIIFHLGLAIVFAFIGYGSEYFLRFNYMGNVILIITILLCFSSYLLFEDKINAKD